MVLTRARNLVLGAGALAVALGGLWLSTTEMSPAFVSAAATTAPARTTAPVLPAWSAHSVQDLSRPANRTVESPVADVVAPEPAHAALPVLQALGASVRDPVQHTELLLSALHGSGPPDPTWSTHAQTSLRSALDPLVAKGALVDNPQCFAAGCAMRVSLPKVALAEEINAAMGSDAFTRWPSGKLITPPLADASGVERQTWIFLAPVPEALAAFDKERSDVR